MMRKFPKLLAVVLALAIIICPAMCLTSMAETANTYSVSYADDAITVNVSAANGLLVALLRLDVLGYTVDEENITVVTDPAIDFSANPDYDAEAGTLSLLLAAKEPTEVTLVNSATVTIPAPQDATAGRQYLALTEVQAADAGTADAPESFLAFEGVDADGILETPLVVVDQCAHNGSTTTEDKDSNCLIIGYTKVTCDDCGEVISYVEKAKWNHKDEDLSGKCDHGCQTTVAYTDNGDGTHAVLWADAAEATNVAHVDGDADDVCDACKAVLATACTHENWGAWEITQPTMTETGLKTRVCADCGEVAEEVIPAAQLDTTMVFRTPDVRIGETFGLRLRARKTALTDTTATYKVVVTPQKYNATTLMEEAGETTEYNFPLDGSNYTLELANIAITELGLDVNAYIVRYNAEGIFEAYGEVLAINPAQLLKGMINDAATEGTTAYKLNTMIADALNLGAAAQDYFPGLLNNTTCDLYTSERVNVGVDSKWASTELGALTTVDTSNNAVWNSASSVTATTNPHVVEVTINPAPTPVFVIRRATATGSNPLTYADLTLVVTYTSTNDGKTRIETVTGDDWNDCVSGKHLKYAFSKVAMYDADQTITATLTYQGTEVFTSTYTLETYVDTNKDNAQLGSIMTPIGKFGISARAYFKSLG